MASEDEMKAVRVMLEKFGFSDGTKDELCLQINPPTQKVKVMIKEDGTDRDHQAFKPTKQGVVDLSVLKDGKNYDVMIVSVNVKPKIVFHQFTVYKSETSLSVRGVDTGATLIESLFKNEDKNFTQAVVLGEYVDVEGKKHQLKGVTSNNGIFKVVLPPGSVQNMHAKTADGSVIVPKRGKITIPQQPPSQSLRKSKSIRIELNPSSFASSVCIESGKAVILGDISGSMSSGKLMPILRKSFLEIVEKSMNNNFDCAIAAWDSWVEWFSTSWIKSSDKADLELFVKKLNARGGNDMRYAIETALTTFPDATDLYIMCDGDVSPFCLDEKIKSFNLANVSKPANYSCESSNSIYRNTPWHLFRSKYPAVKFHFIALGEHSSASHMQEMADIGDGTFWESS